VTALPETARRIPELDGIRGVAILLVLVWHLVSCMMGSPPPLFRFLNAFWCGVDLFFVLSGFLIGGILLDHRTASNYYSVFYRRRICRILPIYFVWLGLFFVAGTARHHFDPRTASWLFDNAMPAWSYATLTQNFFQAHAGTFGAVWMSATWSLAVEEQFYLFLPFLIRVTPTKRLPWILIPLIAAAPLCRALLYDPGTEGITAYVTVFCRTDALLLGTLCAWFVRQEDAIARIRKAMPALRVTLLSCGGFVLLTAYTGETAVTWISRYTLLALAFASWLLIALYDERSLLARAMRVRPLRAVGIVAYGTYLVHNAVNGVFWSALRGHPPYFDRLSDVFLTPIPLLGSLAIAAASWRYFEKPIVKFGQRARFDDHRPLAISGAGRSSSRSL